MVRRIYVEKKPEYAVQAAKDLEEVRSYLGIEIKNLRLLNRYDIEGLSDEVYERALRTVFSEPPVDILYEGEIDPEGRVFSVEYLPGQFDQRADSAVQCIGFLDEKESPVVKTAFTYIIEGDISDSDFEKIKKHFINPVDSGEASPEIPHTLNNDYKEPEDIKILEGFISENDESLEKLYEDMSLAMTFRDFVFIRDYFRDEEKRDPSVTEIRVLDTYWSDHCRHTTFSTELKKITFEDGFYRKPMEETYLDYKDNFKKLYKDRDDKYICLMDLAIIGARLLKKEGKLKDQEVSDEINACSVIVPVLIDGKREEWLINFKNETHNHPTEIEPFGGAATCLGGAIRDPLSGRTYVYQAMRITGAADPRMALDKTPEGKLPQIKIVREAARGYSSYGNQIGLATGYVKEIYHPDYVAKRMEIGAVMAAAPRSAVKRLSSDPGDLIILIGGRTGRDGIGGATGSSKAHNTESASKLGAEVQKGNPPTERKLQRLFRRKEVSLLIKKCNDFGAGGVSVAIGELAPGLIVDLDKVPKKYAGLDGTELAISESQERMAVVVAPEDKDKFLSYAAEENLEAVVVATVTEEPRMIIKWRGREIVNIKRSFIDTNGAKQETDVFVDQPDKDKNFLEKPALSEVRADLSEGKILDAVKATLRDINVASEKGLSEMFDSSIGAGTVLMPYGGKYQLTEIQSMVSLLPTGNRRCDTVTLMAYGFDPWLMSWSPYHGAQYSVLSSISKIIAAGGNTDHIHFSFQEYFRKMTEDPERWSQPFAALLGAYRAQMETGLASIGGKDSMSGTFNDIDVPPTLVSFAEDTALIDDIISPEFKTPGDPVYLVKLPEDEYSQPDFKADMAIFAAAEKLIHDGAVKAAYSVEAQGPVEALLKMAFGNRLGFRMKSGTDIEKLFMPCIGSLVLEADEERKKEIEEAFSDENLSLLGFVSESGFRFSDAVLGTDDAISIWEKPLDCVYKAYADGDNRIIPEKLYHEKNVYVKKENVKPRVFIPVFPGTNCEFDSAKAFEAAGAETSIRVFRNRTPEDIKESIKEFAEDIRKSNIVMFPGGFSGGDEPEGSAKFFATAFRNDILRSEIDKLLDERDGLILGICNGFQALIKLGLVPYGEIKTQSGDSPTLTYNTLGRHISHEVYLKVCSDKSPWLMNVRPGEVFVSPASHGEGRFVCSDAWLKKLFENGQVATQYCDPDGNVSMDGRYNVNGSYMAIEGITSPDGRIFGKMAHAERRGKGVAINIKGEQDMRIFRSGVEYFSL